jgi:hypothetical protein
VSTPRVHLRPDRRGRERPPLERVRGRPPGWQRGSLTPQIAIRSFIRAASEAAKNAATTAMDGERKPSRDSELRFQCCLRSARFRRRERRSIRRCWREDNSGPERCPPFCPLAHRVTPRVFRENWTSAEADK